MKNFIMKLLPNTWHLQLNRHDFFLWKWYLRQCNVKGVENISRRSKNDKCTCKMSTLISCKCHVCGISFKMKCYIRNYLQKKAPDIFCFQVQDFNISNIFYTIQNLKKWKMKSVVPFLPRNLKLHSPCAHKIVRTKLHTLNCVH